MVKYAANWKALGKNLNIDKDLLNIIEKDHPYNCENCCSKMLSDWLDLTPGVSWGILHDAVDKLQDKLNTAADKLDCASNKLPDTVEKLDTAADRLPIHLKS